MEESSEQTMAVCEFNKNHKVPKFRIMSHYLNKCKDYRAALAAGSVFTCVYDSSHIFSSWERLNEHEETCELKKEFGHLYKDDKPRKDPKGGEWDRSEISGSNENYAFTLMDSVTDMQQSDNFFEDSSPLWDSVEEEKKQPVLMPHAMVSEMHQRGTKRGARESNPGEIYKAKIKKFKGDNEEMAIERSTMIRARPIIGVAKKKPIRYFDKDA